MKKDRGVQRVLGRVAAANEEKGVSIVKILKYWKTTAPILNSLVSSHGVLIVFRFHICSSYTPDLYTGLGSHSVGTLIRRYYYVDTLYNVHIQYTSIAAKGLPW